MNTWKWSPIERDVLQTLALRVRTLTVKQVLRGWCSKESEDVAQSLLARLEAAELVKRHIVEAHPIINLNQPLLCWKIGNRRPSLSQLEAAALSIRERWTQPHHAVEVYTASKRTAVAFGGFVDATSVKHCEATHDLHLSEIYLHYRQHNPVAAASWLGEAAFPKLGLWIRGMKDPDAFLISNYGRAERIIEFSGNYEMDHLISFNEHCTGKAAVMLRAHARLAPKSILAQMYQVGGTSYELW